MKRIIINFLALVIIYCMPLNSYGQNSIGNIEAGKIDHILSFFPSEEPGGTFLITKKEKTLYQNAFGKSNLELNTNMKLENVLGIASVTKPFTAISIFKLIEEGKISLEDPVAKFIPAFPNKKGKITIEHLLSHTSGLPYFSMEERKELASFLQELKSDSSKSIPQLFANKDYLFPPGDQYNYSNEAYLLLGFIITKITGRTFESYLNKLFFIPLDMKSTQLENFSTVIKNRATGYDSFNANPYKIKKMDDDNFTVNSAGGLLSSVNDLSSWYQAVMANKIINKESIELATDPFTYNDGTIADNSLGWNLGNLNGHSYIWHDGLTWGYGSVVIYFPDQDLFIAHLRNCGYCKYDRGLSYSSAIRSASVLLNSEYLGKGAVNTTIISDYEGVYTSNISKSKTIMTEADNIYLKSSNGFLLLQHLDADSFFIEPNNETITFNRNKKGEIIGLTSTVGRPINFIWTKASLE